MSGWIQSAALAVSALLLVGCVTTAETPVATAPADPKPSELAHGESKPSSSPTSTPRPLPTAGVSRVEREVIAEGLQLPQSLAFAPDGRLFFVEVFRGAVRVASGRQIQEQPVLTVRPARGTEQGLIGLVLSPAFDRDRYLYTYYTDTVRGNDAREPRRHRLTRWIEQSGAASAETVILDDLPVGKCCHTGGKMAFAADGALFLALGDQGDASRRQAQDPKVANGKILKLDPGLVEKQQPHPSSLVWASGLRNPYGLDVHPVTGDLFLTDNGPDMCDELNLARQGTNFGNPVLECSEPREGFVPPLWDSGPDRYGLTGLRIYRGAMFPELNNQPLFCAINTGQMMRAVLSPDHQRLERVEELLSGRLDGEGCRLDLAVAADGSIYYSSVSKIFRLFR